MGVNQQPSKNHDGHIGEVWPVMLTPFRESGEIDETALDALIDFYQAAGVTGLFAVCQSSEMFFLSLAERVRLAQMVKSRAKVPVIASGHVSYAPSEQARELNAIVDTGVDAIILITNRLADQHADSKAWIANMRALLKELPSDMPLGLYECPYPFKWVLGDDEIAFCADSGRFRFLKDTCCDLSRIQRRLAQIQGSELKLYNANTATLLDSLRAGAAGFSGVMANFHPDLYVWLGQQYQAEPEKAVRLQALLTLCSQIEKQCYPVNAKAYLGLSGLPITRVTRTRSAGEMTPLFDSEVAQLKTLTEWAREQLTGQQR